MSHEKIPLAAVIGSPIRHSKSPLLHNHWLKHYGIQGHYIPIDVDLENLETTLRTLPKMGFVGVNITIPYKEEVLKIADIITDHARLIGAANTLVFGKDGKIYADNTDGYGFITNLKSGAPEWEAQAGKAAVLGAGGAARAVLVSLLDAGVPEIIISNRTRSRAETLAEEFGQRVQVVDWGNLSNMLEGANLLVNTTSLGMDGKPELSLSFESLTPNIVVTDLVYAPLKTKLLQTAQEKGCVTVDGLGMLLHQAVPAFERWFDVSPQVDEQTRKAVLG